MCEKIDFSYKPVLEGEKVILRPFKENDWEKMLVILEEPELRRLTGSVTNEKEAEEPTDPKEAEVIKQWYLSRNEQTDRLDLAIIDKESGELVGEVVFNEYDETTGNVNFRVLMRQSGCNKGLGTEAIFMFIKYGMTELGIHKIGLEVYSFNPRAERVYQKAGFVLEGVKREDFCYNGEYIDTRMYGMLREDYFKK
ncbi:GNAT family N-acetyltransferase [Anaerocolumna xylanovorans]|uniref:Protein N-acetyltransferase, RimJ/RimL family n=1 Tax=Anaerocolumna xylanovorans DSM 12503 TaxID=1121345 RepID=A0A1M7XX22_9FIRM|nr:GNAT family protein [Anaerocolumna xylanovorans]SHO43239.1 Protein N-acetyltransferase, RimJ/RimL family [Anaerocolumna xylanovorans DSM 12503]